MLLVWLIYAPLWQLVAAEAVASIILACLILSLGKDLCRREPVQIASVGQEKLSKKDFVANGAPGDTSSSSDGQITAQDYGTDRN